MYYVNVMYMYFVICAYILLTRATGGDTSNKIVDIDILN